MSLRRNIPPDPQAIRRALGLSDEVWKAIETGNVHDLIKLPDLELEDAMNRFCMARFGVRVAEKGPNTTAVTYVGVLRSFLEFMKHRWRGTPEGSWTVQRITLPDVEDFVLRPKKLGEARGARSVNRDTSILSAFMKWLRKHRHIQLNPAGDVDRPKEPKLLPVALSEDEQEQLLHLSRQTTNGIRNHTVIHLVLNTGLRVSEVSTLRLSNIDLENGAMRVKGKGQKERTIPLRPCVVDSLRYHWNACRSKQIVMRGFEDYVFINEKGARWGCPMSVDALEGMLKPLLLKLGKPTGNMHVLRHSFAVNLLRRGMHIVEIGALLGHESFETTREYLRLGDQEVARAFAKLFPEGALVPRTQVDLSDEGLREIVSKVYGGN